MISSSRQYCVLLLQNEAGNIKLYYRPTGCTTCLLDNVYVAVNFLFQLIFVFPLFQIH